MKISAINNVNNLNNKSIQNNQLYKSVSFSGNDNFENIDFNAMADAVNLDHPENKTEAPVKFFITSVLLTAASFVATKKLSTVALKTIESKLALSKLTGNWGITINRGINALKAKPKVEISGFKTWIAHHTNKTLNILGNSFETLGRKGIEANDLAKFKELMGTNAPEGALYAQNALRKTAASILGLGSAGATVASRYQDENGNGIPDRLEKTCNKLENAKDILKNVAAVLEVAA